MRPHTQYRQEMKLAAYKLAGHLTWSLQTLSNRLRHVGGRAKVRTARRRFYSIAAITAFLSYTHFLVACACAKEGASGLSG